MIARLLKDNFALLADMPGGVQKLRELVLQLAVQNRLVVGVGEWRQLALKELGDWALGSGFPTREQGHTNKPILFCKVSDMNLPGNERFINTTANTIDSEAAECIGARIHDAGTVVFPKIGGAISTNKRRILTRPTAIDNNCLGITPNKHCTTEWLHLVLSSIDFAEYQSGTSVPALAQGTIGEIGVGLPPIAEQKRIVAKVDELMALCDELEARQEEAKKVQVHLNQSALTRLAQSADFSNDWKIVATNFQSLEKTPKNVSELRTNILQLAVMGRLAVTKNGAQAVTGFVANQPADGPFEIPSQWSWVRLGDVLMELRYGTAQKCDYRQRGTPVIRIPNVVSGIVTADDLKFGTLPSDEAKALALGRGDILVIRSNGSASIVGRFALVPEDVAGYAFAGYLIRLRLLSDRAIPEYICLASQSSLVRDQIEGPVRTTSGVKNINGTEISRLLFPLPPLAEQKRIVAKVGELMKLCDELEAQLERAEADGARLFESIVAGLTAT